MSGPPGKEESTAVLRAIAGGSRKASGKRVVVAAVGEELDGSASLVGAIAVAQGQGYEADQGLAFIYCRLRVLAERLGR
jgi:hypothetical protein